MEYYPMLIPGLGNYGTVNIKTTHRNRHFKIKIYPRLVYVIKLFNSRLQGSIPKTLQAIRNQAAGAVCMILNLGSKEDQAAGGFRIEVTVKAKSHREAHQLVRDTGFLDPSYWSKGGDGNVTHRGLRPLNLSLGKDILPTQFGSTTKLPNPIVLLEPQPTEHPRNKPRPLLICMLLDRMPVSQDLPSCLTPMLGGIRLLQPIEPLSSGSSLQTINPMIRSENSF